MTAPLPRNDVATRVKRSAKRPGAKLSAPVIQDAIAWTLVNEVKSRHAGGFSPGGISGSGSASTRSCQPAEEELQFLLRHRGRQRVAQVVLVRVVLGRVVAALFAFGDDVVLEGHRSLRGSA